MGHFPRTCCTYFSGRAHAAPRTQCALVFFASIYDRALTGACDPIVCPLRVAPSGNLDILVNNAGVSQPTMLDADDATYEAAWAFCFAVNVAAQQRLTRAV